MPADLEVLVPPSRVQTDNHQNRRSPAQTRRAFPESPMEVDSLSMEPARCHGSWGCLADRQDRSLIEADPLASVVGNTSPANAETPAFPGI